MIPKAKAPGLNREMRRHPKRYLMQSMPSGSGMPWLLLGLLQRGGFMADVGIRDMATGMVLGQKVEQPKVAAKPGLISRIAGRVSRWFKG